MPNRILAIALTGLLVCALVSVPTASARAKPDKQTRLTEKVKSGIFKLGTGKDSLVAVKLRDKKVLVGYISEAKDETFVVSGEGPQSWDRSKDRDRNRDRRRNRAHRACPLSELLYRIDEFDGHRIVRACLSMC